MTENIGIATTITTTTISSSSSEAEEDSISARVAAAAVSGDALHAAATAAAAAAAAGGRSSRGRRLTKENGKDDDGQDKEDKEDKDKEEEDRDYAAKPLKAYQIKAQDALHKFLDRTFAPNLVEVKEEEKEEAKKREAKQKKAVSNNQRYAKCDTPEDDDFRFFSCVPSGVPALICGTGPSSHLQPAHTHSAVPSRRSRPVFSNEGSRQERIRAAVVDTNYIIQFALHAADKAQQAQHILNLSTNEQQEQHCEPNARKHKVVTQVLRRIGRHANMCNRIVRFTPLMNGSKEGEEGGETKEAKREVHTHGVGVGSVGTPEHRKRKDRLGEREEDQSQQRVGSVAGGDVSAQTTTGHKRKSQRARQKAKKRALKAQTTQVE